MSRWEIQGVGHWNKGRAMMSTVVVYEAETGRKLTVELAQGEDGADVLRAHLRSMTGVPPGNQILLCGGPPYKPLRSHLPAGIATTIPTAAAPDTATSAIATTTDSQHSSAAAGGSSSSSSSGTAISATVQNKNKIFLFDWRTLAPERKPPTSPAAISGSGLGHSGSGGGGGGGGRGEGMGGSSSLLASRGPATVTVTEAEMAEFVGPIKISLPAQPRAAPSPLPPAEGSVLLATIANYERGSMLAFNRGHAYADSSVQRLRGGEACFEMMQTQIEALGAAISNSLDHWEPLQQSHRVLSEKLDEQALRHQEMLETFDQDLARLGTVPLHPSLAAATALCKTPTKPATSDSIVGSRAGLASEVPQAPAAFGAGDGMGVASAREGAEASKLTLLDCVPVEREKKLLESCRTSQKRFRQEAKAVAQQFNDIKNGLEEQRKDPVTGSDMVQGLLERARELCREQERWRGELEVNYRESFTLASQKNWTGDQEKQDAIQRMTELTVTQEKIVPLMKGNDLQVMETVTEIARAKATLTATLRRRLREVSKLQTDIGKIQKRQELVGMAWGQKEEQFEHLGKVARMPAAYEAFLLEVIRRRRYHLEFETKVAEFCDSMEARRSTEIVAREAFREKHVGNLPPVFIEMAPGLRSGPSVFAPPPVTPLYPGELPDVRPEDVEYPQSTAATASSSPPPPAITPPAAEPMPVQELPTVPETAAAAMAAADKRGLSATGDESAEAAVVAPGRDEGQEKESEPPNASCGSSEELAAENMRLAQELADARARLERLEREREEAAAAGAAAAVAAATKTTSVSDSLLQVLLPSGGGGGGGSGDMRPPMDGVAKALKKLPDTIVYSSPPPKDDDPDRRRSFSDVAKRRSSSAERQHQLAAYRAGLSMLVKLADQLAAGAAAGSVTAGAGASPVRVEWEASPLTGAKRTLGIIDGPSSTTLTIAAIPEGDTDPTIAPAAAAAAGVAADTRITADAAGLGGADAGKAGGDDDHGVLNVAEQAATGQQKRVEEIPAADLATVTAEAEAEAAASGVIEAPQDTQEGTEASTGSGSAGAAQLSGTAAGSAGEAREVEVGEGKGGDTASPVVATATRRKTEGEEEMVAQVGAGVEGGSATGAGAAGSSPAAVVGGQQQQQPPAPPEQVADEKRLDSCSALSSAESPAETEDDGAAAGRTALSPNNDAACSSRGGVEVVAGLGGSNGGVGVEGGKAAAAAAVVVTGERELVEGYRTGGGVGGGTGGKAGAGAGSADVERIRKAAEHVAGQLRRTHHRVEQLLPYEELAAVPRISMCSFSVQDIALFLPTMVGPPDGSGGTVFLAFHVNCPNRYLSEESINIARQGSGSYPAYVLGRIIMIEQHVATEEPNPYNVANKTVYYVLTAENVS